MIGGTLAQVNAALRAAGRDERLVRGRGYFYFRGGAAMSWFSSSVYVSDVDALTVTEWLAEYAALSAATPVGTTSSTAVLRIVEEVAP